SREELALGEALLNAIVAAHRARPDERLHIRGTACMSACSRACTVALHAAGKHSYLFGDLAPEVDTAEQVLACARLHAGSADGLLAWSQRPERLRRGILARLPALESVTGLCESKP
ncbi:MAG TPA: DUF1636 domain-containing protein, partial [Burkholderiaceae bacterium]|nr:DUF1636 domain-containing protein [Burkholderiaceae bacterium]